MKSKDFFLYASIVFAFVFVAHGLRIILGWDAVFAGWVVPEWVSWAAVIIVGYLGYNGFKLGGYIK